MLSESMMHRLAKPMLFAAALIWGTSFFIMKNALDALPVCTLLAIRFTVAATLLAVIFFTKWKYVTVDDLWRGAVIGAFLFCGYLVQTFGLARTTPSKNAFFTAVYCVIVPFLYWIVARRRPDRWNVLAALLCLLGVGLVSLGGEALTGLNAGDALTLCAAFFFAMHIVAVAKVSPGKDIGLLTVLQFAFAGLYGWIGAALFETVPPLDDLVRPGTLIPLAYLCVMATAVTLLFQNLGQIWCDDPTATAVILSLESVFGVLFSVIFYGDKVTALMALGFGVIFLGILCSETKLQFLRRR